ncbi:hypothetical protein DE146DRAFT_233749 [Phaeosphaeria sp. MPI-PUGE-AT-0046c]|nr:hypothetical protein DE146DRAFT_233749 [Phaeosphaeria sp. MPI-PUGE-AT-0046c]
MLATHRHNIFKPSSTRDLNCHLILSATTHVLPLIVQIHIVLLLDHLLYPSFNLPKHLLPLRRMSIFFLTPSNTSSSTTSSLTFTKLTTRPQPRKSSKLAALDTPLIVTLNPLAASSFVPQTPGSLQCMHVGCVSRVFEKGRGIVLCKRHGRELKESVRELFERTEGSCGDGWEF